jgi:hypothetical protein
MTTIFRKCSIQVSSHSVLQLVHSGGLVSLAGRMHPEFEMNFINRFINRDFVQEWCQKLFVRLLGLGV